MENTRLAPDSASPGGTSSGAWPDIGDYAAIGNCRTAALVAASGAIEWLSVPRFDSPSVFGAMLDRERGGHFSVTPEGTTSVSRRYVDRTNVLETTFRTFSGLLRLTDAVTVASEAHKACALSPAHEIIRRIEVLEGVVDVEVVVDPRPGYGTARVKWQGDDAARGLACTSGANALAVRSEIPLVAGSGPGFRGTARLRAGDRRFVSMTFEEGLPLVFPPLGDEAERALETSIRWWQDWAAGFTYEGPFRDAVLRSALALKLMTFAPSGAVVAALTTSLPEKIGGVRNWDYRYCWLRDASLTLRALFDVGFAAEAEAFLSWMLHATRLTWPALQVLYDVHGRTRLPERELDHLAGYAGSRPVRVGNGAANQLQLDIYGEVIDAAARFVNRGGTLDPPTSRMLAGLGATVVKRWREPDEGIWEVRGGRRHHTVSKALCWIALDRLIDLARRGHVRGPGAVWAKERDEIRAVIEARGYNEELGSYVSVLDGGDVDASLLLLGLHGYAHPSSPRMRGTCARISERLGTNGLLYRYLDADGLPEGEGAFGICSFWSIECQARRGEVEQAEEVFAHVLSFANDVGLFAEEIDPERGAALGNFPQAFTHVGLINAALTLDECRRARRQNTGQPAASGVEVEA